MWRSRLLTVPDLPGLRPTTDRIRETLFNWLGQDLSGFSCLDLFAGTGALGLEAASRGASQVTLLEKDKKAHFNLVSNLALLQSTPIKTQIEVLHKDSLAYAKQLADKSCDLIFIDPPFLDRQLLEQILIEANRICDASGGGGIYVEFPSDRSLKEIEALLPDWHCGKYLEAGLVKACLFRGGKG